MKKLKKSIVKKRQLIESQAKTSMAQSRVDKADEKRNKNKCRNKFGTIYKKYEVFPFTTNKILLFKVDWFSFRFLLHLPLSI